MINLDRIGNRLEKRGEDLSNIKPMSIRRFSWELHKLLFKIAVFAGIVAFAAHHTH